MLQQGASDCGVACLLSIIQYYGGDNQLENLRRLSGTNTSGTTLLGLQQAASQAGFIAEGCEADIAALQVHGKAVLLHVIVGGYLQHYVVCFGFTTSGIALIGDPAKGIVHMCIAELEKIWINKTCLTLEPSINFIKKTTIKGRKKQWIKIILKEDYPLLTIAAAIGVGIALLSLAMAIFSQRLIDDILPKKEYKKLYLGTVLVLLLLFAKEGLSFLRLRILLQQGKDFNLRIIKYFYTHLLRLPKPFFDTRKIGELTARLNDTARIQKVISQIAGNTLIDVLTTVITIAFLFFYSWKVALAALCFLPIYFFLIRSQNKKILRCQKDVMISYAASESNYISTLQGIETLKNFQKEGIFEEKNNAIYNNYQEKIMALGKIQVKLSFKANIYGNIFLVTVLAFCSYWVLNNTMHTGEVMAVLGMCSSLMPSVTNLALLLIPLNEAKIAFERIFEFTHLPNTIIIEKKLQQLPIFSFLQVKNLSFRFAGWKKILKNISFEISQGEIIAIVGENGCGKSTLTQILQRHYLKEAGEIHFNSTKFEEIPLHEWLTISGCVSQQPQIFNTSVLENIAFEDALNNSNKVLKFLEEYGFTPYINLLPQSYNTLVGEEGINLSGGQKQVVAIARALYHDPQLLILDEATASMDRQTEKFIINLLTNLKQKIAVIFITHKFDILPRFADRIYVLENGKITASGNHSSLLIAEKNLYSDYWNDL